MGERVYRMHSGSYDKSPKWNAILSTLCKVLPPPMDIILQENENENENG